MLWIQCSRCGSRYSRPQGTLEQINAGYCCQVCGAKAFVPVQPQHSTDESVAGLVGGAALGGAIAGPVGAVVGGLLGFFVGQNSGTS
jgi:DNA-directed RNA polymerase subunit RPC12/RpoP